MKRSILMLLLMSAALIFFGCEKETIQAPGSDQNDLEETALKGVKAGRSFSGICTFVKPVPNTWHDEVDDWRLTGTSIWVQPDPAKFEGTCTIIVDGRNPHEESAGKWEMDWVGSITPTDDGLLIVGTGEGTGVEGKVKGMMATWTYTMNYVGTDFPNPLNPTFVYIIEGKIIPPGQAKKQ